jgi:hypothetical protein
MQPILRASIWRTSSMELFFWTLNIQILNKIQKTTIV